MHQDIQIQRLLLLDDPANFLAESGFVLLPVESSLFEGLTPATDLRGLGEGAYGGGGPGWQRQRLSLLLRSRENSRPAA